MTPIEEEDAKVRRDLQALARHVDNQLPYGWGFVILAFPFGADGRMNYVANGKRVDVVRAMYEFIEATKEQWAEHEPELGSAAEDEQLARTRQRIAELERLVKRAADALEEVHSRLLVEDAEVDWEIIAELRREIA